MCNGHLKDFLIFVFHFKIFANYTESNDAVFVLVIELQSVYRPSEELANFFFFTYKYLSIIQNGMKLFLILLCNLDGLHEVGPSFVFSLPT